MHVRSHQRGTEAQSGRGIVVAGGEYDLQRMPVNLHQSEPLEYLVEQAHSLGGRTRRIIHVAGHAKHIHPFAFNQRDEPFKRLALVVQQIDAFEPSADMPVGSM